jgi:hypothetical protein
MTKSVATFWNLGDHDDERDRREKAFEAGVCRTFSCTHNPDNPNFDKKAYDDKGDWIKDYTNQYLPKARHLGDADIYFATCRPTLRAIYQVYHDDPPPEAQRKPIVVGGMFYPGNWAPMATGDPYLVYYKNVHGYVSYDLRIVKKWIDLLLAVFTAIERTCDQIAVITDSRQSPWDPSHPHGTSDTNWGATVVYREIQARAAAVTPHGIGVQLFGIDKTFEQIKHDLKVFKDNYPNGGIIVPALTLCANKRQGLIDYINSTITLPIVYPNELYVRDGGLISLGIDLIKMYRSAGEVVGQFLQNPAASQQLTLWADSDAKFEVALNTTTAGSPYNFDGPKIDKLKRLANQNKIGPPWLDTTG